MMDLHKVIEESRPMLEEFLSVVGIYREGDQIADSRLLGRFSDWLTTVEVGEDDVWFLVARIAVFICEYAIDLNGATRHIEGKRILLRLAVDKSQGVYRDFDPYEAAVGIVRERKSLKDFVSAICG
jgi:hypothetical protein